MNLFITWQDAISYDDKQTLIGIYQDLRKQSVDFLTSLKSRIEVHASSFSQSTSENKKYCVEKLANTAHLYITALLCFTHSKAILQINSFKKETALIKLATDLFEIIQKFYLETLGYDTWRQEFSRDALLYSLAMSNNENLSAILDELPESFSSKDLRLEYLQRYATPNLAVETNYGTEYTPGVTWKRINYFDLDTAKILRNVLRKTQAVISLINKLKNEDVEWSDDKEVATKLVDYVEQALLQRNQK